jgi:hypothetical protein
MGRICQKDESGRITWKNKVCDGYRTKENRKTKSTLERRGWKNARTLGITIRWCVVVNREEWRQTLR